MVREVQELSCRQGGTDYECPDLVQLPAEAGRSLGDLWKTSKNDEFWGLKPGILHDLLWLVWDLDGFRIRISWACTESRPFMSCGLCEI